MGILAGTMVSTANRFGAYQRLHDLYSGDTPKVCLQVALGLYTLELLNADWKNQWSKEQSRPAPSRPHSTPANVAAVCDCTKNWCRNGGGGVVNLGQIC